MELTIDISKEQARRFLLAHQGLWPPNEFKAKRGILAYIRRVGCIQFDPLDIVGQNPDLVLQSRVAGYRPKMLDDLLYKDRRLLDGWDKNMSIYGVEDWSYFCRRREAFDHNSGRSADAIRSVLTKVRAELEERGPLSSLDLEMHEKVDWDWSQSRLARAALEKMYFSGELVIHHKVHTRKIYDFATRCLPPDLLQASDPNQTEEEYQDWYVLRRIGSVGLLWNRAGQAWLGMQQVDSKARKAALERLLVQGKIGQAHIHGMTEPFYFCSEDRARLERALYMDAPLPKASVMAPLDNLLWDRRMLKQIFDFAYLWEVYVPLSKRRYGYYVLPVLYGDRFIARFEPGSDKPGGAFAIKNWWWEAGVKPSRQMKSDLVECFQRFLAYLGANHLEVAGRPLKQAGLEWLARGYA